MNVTIFGASKGLGAQAVARALERGHTVTAFARHPERLPDHRRLTKQPGDVLNPESVAKAIEGQDAAIITLGLPTTQALGLGRSRVIAEGTRNVIAAAEQAGARRLILETAIGAGGSAQDVSLFSRLSYRVVLRWLFRQKDEQEKMARASALDWTIVRPTALTNGPRIGCRVEERIPAGLLTHVSRADVADVIVRALDDPGFSRRTVTVSYGRHPLTDFAGWLRHYRG